MTTYNVNIPVPVKRNTTAGWASDVVVYPAGMHLQVTDNFYTGTDQPRFKIANGTDAFSALDFVPAGASDTTMATANTTQDADRTHSQANYMWVVQNGNHHRYEYNSTAPSGLGNFQITTSATTFADRVFQVTTGLGDAMEVRGNMAAYFRGGIHSLDTYCNTLLGETHNTTTLTLANNIIASSVGIRAGYLTTAARTALSPVTFEGITVYDADTKSYWYADGTNWVEQ